LTKIKLMRRQRHIRFEDFSVYVPNHAENVTQLTKEHKEAISQLYPGIKCIPIIELYLNILVDDLPPRP
jgi:cyclophilin family peptidyl-prolyl cis-trans isomerase